MWIYLVAPVCDTPFWPHMWIYQVAPVCDTPFWPHMWIYLVDPVWDTPLLPTCGFVEGRVYYGVIQTVDS